MSSVDVAIEAGAIEAGAGVAGPEASSVGRRPSESKMSAVALLREHLPTVRVRLINVVDLMTLQPQIEHPHGISDDAFDALFTTDRPIIFAFHGYPALIHRLTYRNVPGTNNFGRTGCCNL